MAKAEQQVKKNDNRPRVSRVVFNPDTLMFQKTIRSADGVRVDTSMHIKYSHDKEPGRNYWVRLVKNLHGYKTPKGEIKPMRFYWEIVRFAPKTHIIYNEGDDELSVNVPATIQNAKETLKRVNEMLRDEGYVMEPFKLEERNRNKTKQITLGFETLPFLRKYKEDR